jgi:hypothetical protein
LAYTSLSNQTRNLIMCRCGCITGVDVHIMLEEEEVLLPQGPSITVPPEEGVPPEEEEFTGPAVAIPWGPLSRFHQRKRRSQQPPLLRSRRKEGDNLSLYQPWYVLHPSFFSKTQEILLTLFSHERGRFVGLEPDLY